MRFREQYEILRKNQEKLTYKATQTNGGFKISGADSLFEAIREIDSLGIIDDEVAELEKVNIPLSIYTSPDGSIQISTNNNQFTSIIRRIRWKTEAVIKSMELSLPEQRENTLVIGLPVIDDFEKMEPFISRLTKSLQMISGNEKISNNEIKFQNFDTGSSWIEITFLAGPIALFLVGCAVDVCAKAANRYHEHKITKAAIKKMEVEEAAKQTIIKSLADGINQDIKAAFQEELSQSEEYDYDLSPEYLSRAQKGIEILSDLMADGTTIQAALNNVETIRETFPTVEEQIKLAQPLYLSRQHQIDTKESNESTSEE